MNLSKRLSAAVVAVAAFVTLTSCADLGVPTPHGGKGRQGWWMSPPDSKGNVYECFYWSTQESTSHWCKPEPVSTIGD
jgi:hypothetical protein